MSLKAFLKPCGHLSIQSAGTATWNGDLMPSSSLKGRSPEDADDASFVKGLTVLHPLAFSGVLVQPLSGAANWSGVVYTFKSFFFFHAVIFFFSLYFSYRSDGRTSPVSFDYPPFFDQIGEKGIKISIAVCSMYLVDCANDTE